MSCARCGARRGSKRVGHGGTLDPLASGVLPICLGEATKLAQFLLDADKEYTFTVCFGVETDTDDAAGAVTARADASAVDAAAVERALAGFRGSITQVPPVYSALKRAGPAALRLRARRRNRDADAARRSSSTRSSWLAFRGPEAATCACAARRGPTYGRWRAISAVRWARARTCRRCAGRARARSRSRTHSRWMRWWRRCRPGRRRRFARSAGGLPSATSTSGSSAMPGQRSACRPPYPLGFPTSSGSVSAGRPGAARSRLASPAPDGMLGTLGFLA